MVTWSIVGWFLQFFFPFYEDTSIRFCTKHSKMSKDHISHSCVIFLLLQWGKKCRKGQKSQVWTAKMNRGVGDIIDTSSTSFPSFIPAPRNHSFSFYEQIRKSKQFINCSSSLITAVITTIIRAVTSMG